MSQTAEEMVHELDQLIESYPGIQIGQSCKKRAFKIGKKSFAYLGEGKCGVSELMIKLSDSRETAEGLAASHPDCYKVGKAGWVTIRFDSTLPDLPTLKEWVQESFDLSK